MAGSLAALLMPPEEEDGDLRGVARLERARRILEAIKDEDAQALADALDEAEPEEDTDDLEL
jgi:hypothetical protein